MPLARKCGNPSGYPQTRDPRALRTVSSPLSPLPSVHPLNPTLQVPSPCPPLCVLRCERSSLRGERPDAAPRACLCLAGCRSRLPDGPPTLAWPPSPTPGRHGRGGCGTGPSGGHRPPGPPSGEDSCAESACRPPLFLRGCLLSLLALSRSHPASHSTWVVLRGRGFNIRPFCFTTYQADPGTKHTYSERIRAEFFLGPYRWDPSGSERIRAQLFGLEEDGT